MELHQAIVNRRSYYDIGNQVSLEPQAIEDVIGQALLHAPSAFHMQSGRAVLLLGSHHAKLWDIVLESLLAIVPADQAQQTKEKIASFAAGYGTVMFFEDQEVVQSLQASFPLYQDNFPIWSLQSSGMIQYLVWTGLEVHGLGASLQHYNPLIDQKVAEAFDIPSHWKLLAQMPFGNPNSQPDAKEFAPLEGRFRVLQ